MDFNSRVNGTKIDHGELENRIPETLNIES